MTDEAMIEAMARALFANDAKYKGLPWEGLAESRLKALFRSDAQAALSALQPFLTELKQEIRRGVLGGEAPMNRHIFNWFNELDPDGMFECLSRLRAREASNG